MLCGHASPVSASNYTGGLTPTPQLRKAAEADFPSRYGRFRILGFEWLADGQREEAAVLVMGEDVGAFGGAFKATKNLLQEFPGRVIDAPISEDAIVGAAVGAAIEGMRPIIEIQFADFSTPAFNQIVNQAATHFWRTRVPCPIVIRLPSGGTSGSGPFHSQCMEGLYSHYPGLVVMTPATVEDAYSMLLEAVALDDPVIFCEHKLLYYHLKAEALPTEALPVGKARLAREGRDMTLVTYSAMVHEALAAAEELAGEIIQMCIALGGSITGEHGVGMEKRQHMASMFAETDLQVMAELRRALDPAELANRGKMFPQGEAPALHSRGPHPLEQQGVISRM